MALDSYKKHQIKVWFKKKKGWVLGTGLFLTLGTVLLIVGFSLTGFDLITWIKSPYFVTCMIVLGVALLCIGYIVLSMIQVKLGIKDDSDDIFNKK